MAGHEPPCLPDPPSNSMKKVVVLYVCILVFRTRRLSCTTMNEVYHMKLHGGTFTINLCLFLFSDLVFMHHHELPWCALSAIVTIFFLDVWAALFRDES